MTFERAQGWLPYSFSSHMNPTPQRVFMPSGPSSESSSADSTTHVLIVDDHPAIREALSTAIERQDGMTVVGTVGTAADVFDVLDGQSPDILIVDISLEDGDGLTLIEDVRSQSPETKVLVYSMHDESLYAGRALRAGALGYVPKSAPTKDVVTAIRRVQAGEVYLSDHIASQIFGKVIRNRQYASKPIEQLTDRELTVFRMIGEGRSVREIADRLDLSRKTVETYRRRAKEKLGYDTVDELLRFAIQWVGKQSGEEE